MRKYDYFPKTLTWKGLNSAANEFDPSNEHETKLCWIKCHNRKEWIFTVSGTCQQHYWWMLINLVMTMSMDACINISWISVCLADICLGRRACQSIWPLSQCMNCHMFRAPTYLPIKQYSTKGTNHKLHYFNIEPFIDGSYIRDQIGYCKWRGPAVKFIKV
jgi:hypothetical protein